MQYSIYNHIRVFYKEADGISTKPPENTSGIAQRMEATLETKTKMPKRSEALKIFNLWNNALEFQF